MRDCAEDLLVEAKAQGAEVLNAIKSAANVLGQSVARLSSALAAEVGVAAELLPTGEDFEQLESAIAAFFAAVARSRAACFSLG